MPSLKLTTPWKPNLIYLLSSRVSWLSFLILFIFIAIQGCQPFGSFLSSSAPALRVGSCNATPFSIKHEVNTGSTPWQRTIELPTAGKFVEESHYVTRDDQFTHRQWPRRKSEQTLAHLKRSFQAYRTYDPKVKFSDLYSQSWQNEWTPEEGGHFGQGSVGEIQRSELSVEMEMWFLTMMWAKSERPARGTKFLLTANDKNVVVIAGYETGPSRQQYLGGVTREVHHWLGTSSKDTIKVHLLENQTLAPGPLKCQ